jgi:hypothetical protein
MRINHKLFESSSSPARPLAVACLGVLAFGAVACKGMFADDHPSGNKGGNNAMGGGSGGSGPGPGTGTGGIGGPGPITGSTGGTGQMGTETEVKTGLPPLPKLTNVKAVAIDDNVAISFDPVDDARDYRVYILPNDSDVTSDGSGRITVKNAIYRCAGDRQAPLAMADNDAQVPGISIRSLVDNQMVDGIMRTLPDATLGHVYTTPGPDRVPVYAMGDPAPNADVQCDYIQRISRWQASRAKKYVLEDEHTMLLGKRWRDDGVAFYVPMAAGGNTRPVYTAKGQDEVRFYYVDGGEADKRGKSDVAFNVLTAPGDGTQPLLRAYYKSTCGGSHDELAVGKSRFERIRHQGDQTPVYDLHWAGLTGETTLVVEALADGCPYQGFFAPVAQSPRLDYPAWLTFDQLKAQSPSGEVYINGQHAATNKPKPIARSFVKVSPGPKPDMDWFEGFDKPDALGPLTETPCGEPAPGSCWQQFRRVSPRMDLGFIQVESDRWGMQPMMGELWVTYGDVGADVNGKFRLTPTQKATMAQDTYIHATMTVDMFTTGRRYPQIILSDQDAPVQWNMPKGYALVIQTISGWPYLFQVELCDHKFWDVNQQCPAFDLYKVLDPNDPNKTIGLAPNDEPAEHMGLDRATRWDVYASSRRVYVYLDGAPYGCAEMPANVVKAGPTTVTFGDVLYHSGVDSTFTYTKNALQKSTRRHYDNLGFKSGLGAPPWDEQRLPCAKVLK